MHNFDTEHFLAHYWQQKPVVLKGFFNHFVDPIDEHDLAGLAQEEDVDSRIISHTSQGWQMTCGPFQNFDAVCQGDWTLLVQGVERYIHEVADIIEPFRFIPNWRLDDLMVSFATKDAGVGPHIDQYDVFLVQGKGKRRWQVGKPGHYNEIFPHPALRQIEGFRPVIDEVLSPGDVLYIPPGWPHDGKALENCLTYSVGFRAPNTAQLADSLALMLDDDIANARFSDARRTPASNPARVEESDINALKEQLICAINSPEFNHSLLRSLSAQSLPEFPNDSDYDEKEILTGLHCGVTFAATPGVRPLIGPEKQLEQYPYFYVNGEQFSFDPIDIEWVMLLINNPHINADMMAEMPGPAFIKTLTSLVNKGYWEWTEELADDH